MRVYCNVEGKTSELRAQLLGGFLQASGEGAHRQGYLADKEQLSP